MNVCLCISECVCARVCVWRKGWTVCTCWMTMMDNTHTRTHHDLCALGCRVLGWGWFLTHWPGPDSLAGLCVCVCVCVRERERERERETETQTVCVCVALSARELGGHLLVLTSNSSTYCCGCRLFVPLGVRETRDSNTEPLASWGG